MIFYRSPSSRFYVQDLNKTVSFLDREKSAASTHRPLGGWVLLLLCKLGKHWKDRAIAKDITAVSVLDLGAIVALNVLHLTTSFSGLLVGRSIFGVPRRQKKK